LVWVVIGIGVLAGCEMHETGATVQSLRDEDAPASEGWGTRMDISEDGIRRLTMEADYLSRFETPDSTYMVLSGADGEQDIVRVVIFDAEGDTSAVVAAHRILYFERRSQFVARGAVRVDAQDGRTLESEHLTWSEQTARVRTPGFATLRTETEVLSGYGFDADEDLTDFSLARVSGIVTTEEEL